MRKGIIFNDDDRLPSREFLAEFGSVKVVKSPSLEEPLNSPPVSLLGLPPDNGNHRLQPVESCPAADKPVGLVPQ